MRDERAAFSEQPSFSNEPEALAYLSMIVARCFSTYCLQNALCKLATTVTTIICLLRHCLKALLGKVACIMRYYQVAYGSTTSGFASLVRSCCYCLQFIDINQRAHNIGVLDTDFMCMIRYRTSCNQRAVLSVCRRQQASTCDGHHSFHRVFRGQSSAYHVKVG